MITLNEHIKMTRRFKRFSKFAKFIYRNVNKNIGEKLLDWNYDRWFNYLHNLNN